jgi:hypothetical protein
MIPTKTNQKNFQPQKKKYKQKKKHTNKKIGGGCLLEGSALPKL